MDEQADGSVLRDELLWQYLRRHLQRQELRVFVAGDGPDDLARRLSAAGHRVTRGDDAAGQAPFPAPAGPGGGERFDVVICHDLLETSADPAGLLRSLVRLLSAGGGLSLLTANRAHAPLQAAIAGGDLELALDLLAADGGAGAPPHRRAPGFRVDEITHLCADIGLALLDVLPLEVVSAYAPPARFAGAAERARLLALELELSRRPEYRDIGRLVWCWGTLNRPGPAAPW